MSFVTKPRGDILARRAPLHRRSSRPGTYRPLRHAPLRTQNQLRIISYKESQSAKSTVPATHMLGNMVGPTIGNMSGVYVIGPFTTLWISALAKQGKASIAISRWGASLSKSPGYSSFPNSGGTPFKGRQVVKVKIISFKETFIQLSICTMLFGSYLLRILSFENKIDCALIEI